MAEDIIFEVEWDGLDELIDEFDKMDKDVDRIIIEELTEFGTLAEEGAKALAPHDRGYLEDSINFDKARRVGREFVVTGGSNEPYALRRHEEEPRMGIHDKQPGDRFYEDGRGAGTRNKPAWRGYEPGRKYLENAIKAIEGDYDEMMARILHRLLEEKP